MCVDLGEQRRSQNILKDFNEFTVFALTTDILTNVITCFLSKSVLKKLIWESKQIIRKQQKHRDQHKKLRGISPDAFDQDFYISNIWIVLLDALQLRWNVAKNMILEKHLLCRQKISQKLLAKRSDSEIITLF